MFLVSRVRRLGLGLERWESVVSRVRGVRVRVGALGKRGFAVGYEYHAECVRQYGTRSEGSYSYLRGSGVLLQRALIRFGLAFLAKRGYVALEPSPILRKDVMEKCAPLAVPDEEDLSMVTIDDQYRFATPEQQLCCYHYGEILDPNTLPIRYTGYSVRHWKEAVPMNDEFPFRVRQCRELWQFCITSPNGNESWDMHKEMIRNSEDFYKELNIPYRVVPTVSGALNLATSKKDGLEAWYPASKTYIELVSCCNYTDYMSRILGIRYGEKKSNEESEQYVHLLGCTLTASEMTTRCILENYRREDGFEIPKALRPYMLPVVQQDTDFLPFVYPAKS